MDTWNYIEYGAWGLSAIFAIYILADFFRIEASYPEDVLISSREGELEAFAEKHKI